MTNRCLEWRRGRFEFFNTLTEPPTHPLTEDYVFEDRTRRGGVNFGRADRTGLGRIVDLVWEVSSERPQFEIVDVIAVRGERSAALRERHHYGNDTYIEVIAVTQMDPSMTLEQRLIVFDFDDVDAALAELDRVHRGIDDRQAG